MTNTNPDMMLKARFRVWFDNRDDADMAIEAAQALEKSSSQYRMYLCAHQEHSSTKDLIIHKCLAEMSEQFDQNSKVLSYYLDSYKDLKVTRHKVGLQVDMSVARGDETHVPNPALIFARVIESTFKLGQPVTFDTFSMDDEGYSYVSHSYVISNGQTFAIDSAQVRSAMMNSLTGTSRPRSHFIYNGRLTETQSAAVQEAIEKDYTTTLTQPSFLS